MAKGSEPLPYQSGNESHTHGHRKTPIMALLDAAAQCEAAGFDEVLIIYNTRDGKSGSYDSGLTTSESGYLCDLFKHWLLNCSTNVIHGAQADAIRNVVLGEKHERKDREG